MPICYGAGNIYCISQIILYNKGQEQPNSKSIRTGYPDAHFVQLGQIENGVNEEAVHWNAKTAFSFTHHRF